MDVRVRVNLHGGPLPCSGWGCGPRPRRTRARGRRPASPPLHDGPFPCAGWGVGPLPATLGRAYPHANRSPLPCASLLPSQKREGSSHLSSPSENGRGGVFPFFVPEHTVWGSLVGSACKAHCGRASVSGQGARSAHRRRWALAGGGASVSWRRCAVTSRRALGVR